MLMVIVAFAFLMLISWMVYLAEFARVSRHDSLSSPAAGAEARWARRLTGMHARGTEHQLSSH